MKRLLSAVVIAGLCSLTGVRAGDGLEIGGDYREQFENYLTAAAQRHWEERAQTIAAITTPAGAARRAKFIRSWIVSAVGGFPAKTPLQARVTGQFQRDGYRVEKVIYESQPGFYVTANLYVPSTGKAPYPGIVGVAGHSATGKAIATYQYAWIALAKRGFVVLAIDPPGQGERSEYFDPVAKKSSVGIGTAEHSMAGIQCLLTGTTFARYEIWDGIRAFDYLAARKEVDPKRIGVAGNSGGGTQSAYLAAVEERLAAAAPSCYITSWPALWTKPGPQDAEQNFPGFIRAGLDFGDFLIAFFPKPVMMLTAIRDFFPIAGARSTYAEVKGVFERGDAGGRAGYFEYDDEHGWSKPRREATYRWMAKWLQGRDDDGVEPEIKPEPEEALNATPTGQLATSLGGKTVRVLNRELAERLFPKRKAASLRNAGDLRQLVRNRLNIVRGSGVPRATSHGRIERQGYTIERLTLETEPGIDVPALVFVPSGVQGRMPAVIYANSDGKAAGAGNGGQIESLVRSGRLVLAPDARGWGESAAPKRRGGYSAEWQTANRAMLIGKTMAGSQTTDLLRSFDYLASRPDVDTAQIAVFGKNKGGVIALYTAVMEPRIARVAVEGAVPSYMSVVRSETHKDLIDLVVPGVLHDFDLPDLAAKAIAPRPLLVGGVRDPMGNPMGPGPAEAEFAPVKAAYSRAGRAAAFRLANGERTFDLAGWLD
ncbi:MAG: acetylxylan esterase [Bryobacteraceae bacterium]|nr:acetylxylan esterase [Bryobacterales bacterium]MEB2363107.1 acetylxylan esterase [Bryobacterales bacterium]NUN00061.1 acetylxylan esterase [Bryobacteraceae bacterium]